MRIASTALTFGFLMAASIARVDAQTLQVPIHEKPSCDPATDPAKGKLAAAQAAGGHLDPEKTSRHEGPTGLGHLGDLPALTVDNAGKATTPVVAPRLKVSDLTGHSLMIHAGGDNYSDSPEKLGGGGERIACGIIQ